MPSRDASSAPATISAEPRSPPRASTAMRTRPWPPPAPRTADGAGCARPSGPVLFTLFPPASLAGDAPGTREVSEPRLGYGAELVSGSTSRPLYVRQFGHMWCGRFGLWQVG